MLYKVTEWFGYNYIMEKKAFNIWMLIIWISDPTVKTSILQTAYRNLTTPIEQAPSQTLSFVQKMYMHWQHFAKNFYGHNANMDGKLDMKENLYHSKEVEKLFCNICITSIHIHPPPLLRFQTVPEKVLTVKDFQIMNTLICQQNVKNTPSSEYYDKFNTTGTNNEIQVWDAIFMPIMEFHTLLCNQLK